MITHDFVFSFPKNLLKEREKLILTVVDLPAREKFEHLFFPSGLPTENGLVYAKANVELAQVLDFIGSTLKEAQMNFPFLQKMSDYRQKHGTEFYTEMEKWTLFFELILKGHRPTDIHVQVIEHY